jgi:hypothetical protein
MDATTTIEIEMTDPANNFFIDRVYTYGDITQILLLITIAGLMFWNLLIKIFDKKNV